MPVPLTDYANALPENATYYRDTGCYLFPSCLNCPRPQCVYDMPERVQTKAERDRQIVKLRKEGVPVAELARAFDISTRVVLRAIQRGGPSQAALDYEERHFTDVQGKPVSAIGSPFKPRRPLPVMRENRRAL